MVDHVCDRRWSCWDGSVEVAVRGFFGGFSMIVNEIRAVEVGRGGKACATR